MKCNVFRKRLEDYVMGNIPSELKISLENHMDGCDSCKAIYEEEIRIDTSFKMALSIEGIEFNSSRTSIISAIDRNRYSKRTSNKILYNFKKYKNRYLSYAVAVIAMIVFIPMILNNFNGESYKSEGDTEKKMAIYKAKDKAKSDKKQWEIADYKASTNIENHLMEFKSTIVVNKELPDYEIIWENSLDGKKSAAIDTMAEKDADFGIHVIYVKDKKTNQIVKYEVVKDTQYTIRNIEWWDNEHLIVVTGFAYGTVNYGSDIYSLTVNTEKFSTLYQVKDEKQQIVGVQKVKNDLILQLINYEDNNYNVSHKAVGKINILDINKPAVMQITNENKK
ncbi:DUF4652 domain-containing protein [Clostridium sp.]|jgi:hypothetical protein|uniref:DUF4652 domain-containing protein n=1 Tax=Clostridium sp. TaxID=1506 RepID=UPI003EF02448